MPPGPLPHGIVAMVVAFAVAGVLTLSQPLARDVAPPVSVGLPSVADDLTEARIPIASAAVDLAASGADGAMSIRDGVLHVPLRLSDHGRQTVEVSLSASGAPIGEIELRYYPSSYYRSIGAPQPGAILLFTTLPRTGAPHWAPGTWSDRPPGDSLAVETDGWDAAREAGELPPATLGADEQLRRLFLQMDRTNDPDRPLCDQSLDAAEAHERVSDGSCSVDCFGYSRILRDLLRSAGTPARVISLGALKSELPGHVVVQSSEGHQTTELWDGERWKWVDGTLGVLRALGPDGMSLSAEEVVSALSDPAARADLRFVRLDQERGEWVTRSYDAQDDAFKESVASLFTADKVLSIPDDGRG